MGLAVSIYKVEKFDLEDLIVKKRGEVVLPLQQDLASEYGLGDKLGMPISKIRLVKRTEEGCSFKVKHYSDTIKETIRFCPEGQEFATDHVGGYQKVLDFWVIYNRKNAEFFCAATKEISRQFQKRLEETGMVKIKRVMFDLQKVAQTINSINVWGAWADVNEGKIKVRAEFGVNVHEAPSFDSKNTTSLAIEILTDDGKEISLNISRDGRIATNCKDINQMDLLKIYDEIKKQGAVVEDSNKEVKTS